ncbi:MAG: NAD-dependent epimerase/dehydratase family protein [Verrucomicrobia bacterium]|nr:NAD-dependent epimerase/dehydratase family protein [Verrucomicrobiota bacterium]
MHAPGHVLVTGGAGFIGSHLVERLLADGHTVTVIDDCSTGRLANLGAVATDARLRVVQAKISEYAGLTKAVAEAACIYHLAAAVGVELVVKEPIRTIHTNLQETRILLEVASQSRVPILLASTSEVYGKSVKPAFSEDDDLLIGPPHLGRWSYACSKLMDEFLALAYARERGLPVVIARLFNTVGPRQTGRYGMVLPRFIAAAKADRPLRVFGDGTQTRCFCYVLDTVEALVRLGRCPAARGEIFNVGSTEEVSIRELAARVVEILRSSSKLELVPYGLAYTPGFEDMQRRRPLIEKLVQVTGYRPATPLQMIIELTADVIEPEVD